MDIPCNLLALCLNQRKRKMLRVFARHHNLDGIHRISHFIRDHTHRLAPLFWRKVFDPWLTFEHLSMVCDEVLLRHTEPCGAKPRGVLHDSVAIS
eukprot:Skav206389  [mRNA]  locus=scaffold834:598563:598847:+ [translate_table: standard]